METDGRWMRFPRSHSPSPSNPYSTSPCPLLSRPPKAAQKTDIRCNVYLLSQWKITDSNRQVPLALSFHCKACFSPLTLVILQVLWLWKKGKNSQGQKSVSDLMLLSLSCLTGLDATENRFWKAFCNLCLFLGLLVCYYITYEHLSLSLFLSTVFICYYNAKCCDSDFFFFTYCRCCIVQDAFRVQDMPVRFCVINICTLWQAVCYWLCNKCEITQWPSFVGETTLPKFCHRERPHSPKLSVIVRSTPERTRMSSTAEPSHNKASQHK